MLCCNVTLTLFPWGHGFLSPSPLQLHPGKLVVASAHSIHIWQKGCHVTSEPNRLGMLTPRSLCWLLSEPIHQAEKLQWGVPVLGPGEPAFHLPQLRHQTSE